MEYSQCDVKMNRDENGARSILILAIIRMSRRVLPAVTSLKCMFSYF
jgi:hypothetical protein